MKLIDITGKTFGIIYKAEFESGKVYIGQTTKSLKSRKNQHLSKLHKENVIFHSAIIKYGENFVEWSVIDTADDIEELNLMEIYWISYYNSYIHSENSNGYNMTLGGEGICGYKLSEEHRRKISKERTGKPLSEEHKRKISENSARLSGQDHYMYGKKHSEETRKKMSENSPHLSGENHPLYGKRNEECHNSKLTWEDVKWIRENKDKYTGLELAEMFPVNNRQISNIINYKTWKEKI